MNLCPCYEPASIPSLCHQGLLKQTTSTNAFFDFFLKKKKLLFIKLKICKVVSSLLKKIQLSLVLGCFDFSKLLKHVN